MIKKSVLFFIILNLFIIKIKSDKNWDADKNPKKWIEYGEKNIKRMLERKFNGNIAKNVILFLGDGMGISTLTAGRIFKGQSKGNNGEEEQTVMESLNHIGLSKTYNIDAQTADSAGTATAYLTGVKTRIGSIGVDGTAVDCKTSLNAKLDSILKWAHYAGKSTGIVTTARVTHATPAGAYANVPDRDWECYDGRTFISQYADEGCKDIAAQLVDDNSFINLVMGGGRKFFLDKTNYALNNTYSETGDRIDNRNLIQEWKNKGDNYKFIWTRNEFDALKPKQNDHILALFTKDHMSFEIDRDGLKEPSIIEMTQKAIEMLSLNPNGYFLLVEGGKIDHGHHESRAQKALNDFAIFDDAIGRALNITNEEDTLITVTADHSHVFTIGGYAVRGNDLFGLNRATEGDSLSKLNDSLSVSYTALLYGNGPGFRNPVRIVNLTDDQTKNKNYQQESAILLPSETHGGEDVAIFAKGPMSYLFDGTFEQSYVAHAMAYSACIGPFNGSNCKMERGVLVKNSSVSMKRLSISFQILFLFVYFFL